MKSVVNFLAVAVRKAPWVVVALTILITIGLGGFASQYLPAEDQNEGFAPDAPELVAISEMGERFGTSAARLQVLTSASDVDVITLDALEAAFALDQSLRASEASEFLIDSPQTSAVLSYLAPVQFAIQGGAPMPTSDAEVKALYSMGMQAVPAEFQSFMVALLASDANIDTATSPYGLTVIAYESDSESFDEAARRAQLVADAVEATPTPEAISQDAFSQELIFASGGDFEAEIARMFAAAGLIILLVLAIVFVVKSSAKRDRGLYLLGVVLMLAGVLIVIAPSLGLVFPEVFPASWGDLALGQVLMTAGILYLAAFSIWALASKKLRRTTADTLLTFLTIGFAIQWVNGVGFLLYEEQSQMTQIIPILLIGLGVDYSIHMTSRYRQELAAGNTVDASIRTAIRTVGIALVLATLTTAVGFLTNVTNDIPAIAEFGVQAAIGIGASFLLMLTFVPAVRQIMDRRGEAKGRLEIDGLAAGKARVIPNIIGRFSVLPKKLAVVTVIASLVGTTVAGVAMTGLSTQFSFLDFVPTTSPIRETAVTIDDNFDFPETTSVLVTGEIATGSAWNAMVDSYADAAEVDSVSSIVLPSGEEFATGNSFMNSMFQLMNPSGESFDQELFGVAIQLGFGQDRHVPPDADVTPLYDVAYTNHQDLMASVLSPDGEGGYDAALFNFDTTAGENGAGDLADGLNAAFEPSRGADLAAIATSNFIISDMIVTTLRDSQVSSLGLTLLAALLLLVINFWFESRRPMLGVVTTVPVAMVVIWVFGAMSVAGIAFGPVTSMVSAVGIGIGIPYMIHVTHRYLEERIEQADENAAIEHTLVHTGGALGGSALTTMAGFGILMLSTTIPFRQFGFVLAYTIFLALMAAVALLPSMLVLWDRWHRRRGDATLDAAVVASAFDEAS
ncbi:MAG: MMPL family transporter [Actinomycetota bacterium]